MVKKVQKMLQKQVRAKMIGTKVTSLELQKVSELVEAGVYLNTSDFVRQAVRDKLEAMEKTEIIRLRDVDYATAKNEVIEYYRTHREAYPSDVANKLGISLEMAYKVVGELKKEKMLGVIE
ncbi:MAG: ribbon-helix-helix domain-containing protein [archaeon]